MTSEGARKPPVDALVEQNSHETDSTSFSFASSRKAITCSRVTAGKPPRNSSIESPASRYSMSVCTGTRVPQKTGVPPMTSGSRQMTDWLIYKPYHKRPALPMFRHPEVRAQPASSVSRFNCRADSDNTRTRHCYNSRHCNTGPPLLRQRRLHQQLLHPHLDAHRPHDRRLHDRHHHGSRPREHRLLDTP